MAVCLDIDDTLLDNERASRGGLRALTGNDAAWPMWRRLTEHHYARFVAGRVDYDTMRWERTRAFFTAFGEWLGDEEVLAREQLRMAAMQRCWSLFDDVLPCLESLRARGLRLAAVTNAAGEYQRRKIAAVGLGDVFDAIVISEEVRVAKPDPRIFETACSELGLPAERVVHVGDRLDVDAGGAARAGLRGVWLNRAGDARTAPEGVSVITSLSELPELMARASRSILDERGSLVR